MANTYDPSKVILSVSGFRVSGFKDEDIECGFENEDEVLSNVGIFGEHSFTENLDKLGFIKFTLKETSPANLVLEGFVLSKLAVPILFKDSSDSKMTVIGDGCRIKNRPTRARGKEEGGVEYIIAIPIMIRASI